MPACSWFVADFAGTAGHRIWTEEAVLPCPPGPDSSLLLLQQLSRCSCSPGFAVPNMAGAQKNEYLTIEIFSNYREKATHYISILRKGKGTQLISWLWFYSHQRGCLQELVTQEVLSSSPLHMERWSRVRRESCQKYQYLYFSLTRKDVSRLQTKKKNTLPNGEKTGLGTLLT